MDICVIRNFISVPAQIDQVTPKSLESSVSQYSVLMKNDL